MGRRAAAMSFVSALIVMSAAGVAMLLRRPPTDALSARPEAVRDDGSLARSLSRMPLLFLPDRGQAGGTVDYYVAGEETSLGFASGSVSMVLSGEEGRHTLRLSFPGSTAVAPVPEARAETTFSWWKGASEDWISAVPTYHRLSYLGLWPGIDLSFSGGEGAGKYRFSVAPGTDPSLISLRYQGATSLRVSPEAELVVSTSLRDLTDPAPVAWSVFPDGSRLPVEAAWAVQGDTASFRLGSHDRSLPLVIDPVMLACATDSLAADSSTQLDHGEILVSSGPWR